LIHTIENTENKFPILKENNEIDSRLKSIPVIIVGNGPSLDNEMELLKARQKDVIVVSCGTALKSLLQNGIRPDIHIEMERTAALDDHYKLFSKDEHKIIKQTPIIALNTVYSGLLNRFSKAYSMLKVNDAGTDLICFLNPNNNFQVVKFCNPTVSNAALMAMLHLGFDNIYLLGVDLGFVNDEQHHSKSSMYYEGEWEGKESSHNNFKGSTQTTKGNFREEVFTTGIFDSSKGVMEFSIKDFPEADVFNCSDGAKIEGATPLPFDELEIIKNNINIKEEISHLLDDSFMQSTKDKAYVHNFLVEEFFPKFRIVIDEFKTFLDVPITSRKALSDAFSKQNDYVYSLSARADTMLYFRFIKGTMIYYQSTIMTSCASYTNEDMRILFITDSLFDMKNHFEFLYAELLNGYNKPAKI
jgi:hypothetical protein